MQGSEVEAVRQAVRATLSGERSEPLARDVYGQWKPLIQALHKAAARGGLEGAAAFLHLMVERQPAIAKLLAGMYLWPARPPISAPELMTTVFEPLRWAVSKIVPEGLTLLAGAPKSGKSWICLDLALAVARGGYALGSVPVESGDVFYLALEDTERRLHERLHLTLRGTALPARLHFASLDHNIPMLGDGGREVLERWLDAHIGARMVIIDTLAKFRARQSSSYYQDYHSMQELLKLAGERRIALVVVHHTRKALSEDALKTISGSFGLPGGVDGALILKRTRGQADAVLAVTGRDVVEQELALRWDGARAQWTIMGTAADVLRSQIRAAILRVLQEEDRPMSPKEVFEALVLDDPKLAYNTIKQRMYRMSKDGTLVVDAGYYRHA